MGAGPVSAVTGQQCIGLTELAIVAALPGEARSLAGRRCKPGTQLWLAPDVRLYLSGIGGVSAAATTRQAIADGAQALVSWGCAGALDPLLNPGALILPARVLSEQGGCYGVDAGWHARLRAVTGSAINGEAILTSSKPLAEGAEKQLWHAESGAAAVDLESAKIAALARQSDIPFVVIRAIADHARQHVPPAALQALSAQGRLQPFALVRSLLADPRQLSSLLQLARSFRAAQSSLHGLATRIGPRLCAP